MKKIFGLILSLLLCLCFVSFGACSPSTKLEYNYPFTETTCYIQILSSKEYVECAVCLISFFI